MRACACAYVCACVRACLRAYVRACVFQTGTFNLSLDTPGRCSGCRCSTELDSADDKVTLQDTIVTARPDDG